MKVLHRPKLTLLMATLALAAVIALPFTVSAAPLHTQNAGSAKNAHAHIDCAGGAVTCTETYDSETVFGEGHYVGHDEPSTLYYSNVPGSGNRNQWQITLPKEPSPKNPLTPGKSYSFELSPAFWFGMAMCDTQSYPELLSTCTPDSDKNIVDPAVSPNHPGTAFMEMQFYPPGWVADPFGLSCDATKWCAALNIDSLSQNSLTGQTLNDTCAATTGVEYVNFAFITKSGHPQPASPPNPVQSTLNTFTPNPSADLFMNPGDKLALTMHDTAHGLQIIINDKTSGESGSMTASAANGFGQVKFAPNPSTECTNIPYDFHPMYSTSSEKTRVTWAAHSYNIAFDAEIGHFDLCTAVSGPGGTCTGLEGIPGDQEPADVDDLGCFPASSSLLVQVTGCVNGAAVSVGFDGTSYQDYWPDGNTKLHPTPFQFSSPLTGSGYNVQYNRMAFEGDQPRVEAPDISGSPTTCDRLTGANCTIIPETDDNQPAVFYPFFSITKVGGQCVWQIGNHIPGSTNDFGQDAQYGTLLNLTYTATGGGLRTVYEDFRQILSKNPCQA